MEVEDITVEDNFSDLDLSDDDKDELDLLFDKAATSLKQFVSKLDSTTLLNLYAHYKQATEGKCNIPKPSWYDMQGKQKWEAWKSLGDMPSCTAKKTYVNLMKEIDSNLIVDNSDKQTKKDYWISVSSMSKDDGFEDNHEKTVFELCQDNDIVNVERALSSDKSLLNKLDDNGLGLIHWACDRGLSNMLELLITYNCNVNLPDESGQTALHYAASCGHQNCISILIQNSADINVKDNDGSTPFDVCSDETIQNNLKLVYSKHV